MSTVRLRFKGEQAVTFQNSSVGYVEPEGEFDVPEDEAERYTRRADIELASTPRKRARPAPSGDDTGTSGDAGTDVGERGAVNETGTDTGDPA